MIASKNTMVCVVNCWF